MIAVSFLPDVCSKYNPAERNSVGGSWSVWWGTRGDALLGLLLVNREGLMSDVMPGGCLGHSSHKMIQFLIPKEVKSWVSRNCKLELLEGRL